MRRPEAGPGTNLGLCSESKQLHGQVRLNNYREVMKHPRRDPNQEVTDATLEPSALPLQGARLERCLRAGVKTEGPPRPSLVVDQTNDHPLPRPVIHPVGVLAPAR